MNNILPDGSVRSEIFQDFSLFTLNNTIIGQYASKINKGSNNIIIGENAGKIGLKLNNSIIIGANTDDEIISANKIISIGEHKSTLKEIKDIITIGYNNPGNLNNIHLDNFKYDYINNKLLNEELVKININDIITSNNNSIYLGIGKFKDLPIIFGSKKSFNITKNNFFLDGTLNTSLLKIKNTNNYYISITTNTNYDIIYKLPPLPIYQQSYLSTDQNGNLIWLDISNIKINIIQSSADIICNGLIANNIIGNGILLNNLNLDKLTTDDLKEGINNLYWYIDLITNIFFVIFLTHR